jgi:hypothetical protein
VKYENLVERAKNPTPNSVVGKFERTRIARAGKHAVEFVAGIAQPRDKEKLFDKLNFINEASKKLGEGQHSLRGQWYSVDQFEDATVITQKRRSSTGSLEQVGPNEYVAHEVPIVKLYEITIERNEAGNIARILKAEVDTEDFDAQRPDFDVGDLADAEPIFPVSFDDQAAVAKAINKVHTLVTQARQADIESAVPRPSFD